MKEKLSANVSCAAKNVISNQGSLLRGQIFIPTNEFCVRRSFVLVEKLLPTKKIWVKMQVQPTR